MTFQNKKKGGGYVVTWDSDASSNIDDSSDDDNKSKKKALASIAINNKPSLFDTPSNVSWLNPLRYNMMKVMMIMKVMIVGVMMMMKSQRKNSWTCWRMLTHVLR